jgi:hypothetical protein
LDNRNLTQRTRMSFGVVVGSMRANFKYTSNSDNVVGWYEKKPIAALWVKQAANSEATLFKRALLDTQRIRFDQGSIAGADGCRIPAWRAGVGRESDVLDGHAIKAYSAERPASAVGASRQELSNRE